MPNKRDLRLDKYDIGVYAYRELNNFCKQYQEKRRKLQEAECAYSAPRFDKAPGASCYDDDQTTRAAVRAAMISRDLEMVEQSAMEAAPEEYALFLQAMVEDHTWNYMREIKGMRMGENDFRWRRRLFYFLLAKRKYIV